MKKLITAFAILALTLSTGAFAQVKRTVAKLPTAACTAGNIENNLFIVTDGDDASDCTSGGGTAAALCICDGGVFVPVSSVIAGDLSAYVPVTKAGQQTITATGVDNDITLTAPDTIVLSIAGLSSLVASSGGDNFALFTSGATNSELNISAGNDADGLDTAALSLYSEDDAATFTMELSNTGPKLSAEQSTGLVTVSRAGFRISPTAAPTVACAGGTEGTLYLDSDTHLLCVCNGTGYVQVADGSTACS